MFRRLKTIIRHWLQTRRNPWLRRLLQRLKAGRDTGRKQRRLRRLAQGQANFVTLDQAVNWAREWAETLPADCDLVIGIPRSGLLVANVIALKLVKPLASPDLFLNEQGCWHSKRIAAPSSIRKVLLVDDSVNSGKTMKQVKQQLEQAYPDLQVITAALIVHAEVRNSVDRHFRLIAKPRFFEWDVMHQKKVERVAIDLEGVLCAACPPGMERDDDACLDWLENAGPYMLPAYRIDLIVSDRQESDRRRIEAWLVGHGVSFDRLALRSPEEEGGYRAKRFGQVRPQLYIAGSQDAAEQVWRDLGVPSLSMDEMVFFGARDGE